MKALLSALLGLTLASIAQAQGSSRISTFSVLAPVNANQTFSIDVALGGYYTTGNIPLLFRAVGPSLAPFGITGYCTNPELSVPIWINNQDWWNPSTNGTQVTNLGNQVGAFPLISGSLDAAGVSPLAARNWTTRMDIKGTGGTSGRVLAEVYDGSTNPGMFTPRLLFVKTVSNISPTSPLSVSFTIGGTSPRIMLILATGLMGSNPKLNDPKVELYKGTNTGVSVLVDQNDDWGQGPYASDVATRVPEANGPMSYQYNSLHWWGLQPKDAAIMTWWIQPGSYTAIMTGVNGTSGIGQLSVFDITNEMDYTSSK